MLQYSSHALNCNSKVLKCNPVVNRNRRMQEEFDLSQGIHPSVYVTVTNTHTHTHTHTPTHTPTHTGQYDDESENDDGDDHHTPSCRTRIMMVMIMVHPVAGLES